MALYTRDPISEAKIRALKKRESELFLENCNLRDEVSKLRSRVERLTGMTPAELEYHNERLEERLRQAIADAEKAEALHKNKIKEGEEAYRLRMQDLKTEIDTAVKEHLDAQREAAKSEEEIKRLDAIREALTNEIATAIGRASADNNPLIFKPTIYGVGIDLPKAVRWLWPRLKRKTDARPYAAKPLDKDAGTS